MQPINLFDYEMLAQQRMQHIPWAWDFYRGGSDDELSLRANRAAFEQLRLRPRMLVDVSTLDLRTSVLGTAVSNGEELVRRAEAAGYQAIVLTVDTPRLSRRERDVRNNMSSLQKAHYPQVFRGNFAHVDTAREPFIGDTITWEVLPWLRSITSLPILLKGILTAEDALLALERGAAGIIVSNHGGRQLDGVAASIEALPEVVEAVGGRCEVYMDGGIRRGTDVLKALAFGARSVLLGRPILWGLAVNGQQGVFHVLQLLRAELELAMALSGCPTIQSVTRSLVR